MLEIPVKLMNAKSGERKRMIVDYGEATITATVTAITHKLGVKPDLVMASASINNAGTGHQAPVCKASDYTVTDFDLRFGEVPNVSDNKSRWIAIAFVDE